MCKSGRRRLLLLFSAAALWLPLLAPAASFFPLDKGNSWSYITETLSSVRTITVTDRTGEVANVVMWFEPVVLRDRVTEIDLDVPEEELALFYRFVPDSTWEHRDPTACNDRCKVSVTLEKEPIVTLAGTFSDCLRIHYESLACMDAGRTDEWWAPGVGLVQWTEVRIFGMVTWKLFSYDVRSAGDGEAFRRGDVNADGILNIADAIACLTILFLFCPSQDCLPPPCSDTADANDDGQLNIADPVKILAHLFARAGPLPPPFESCGNDSTDDPLECASFPPCEKP